MAINITEPQERTIEFNGGDITVRGLSIAEIVESCEPIAREADRLFDRGAGSDLSALLQDEAHIRSLMWMLFQSAPTVVANLIARAAEALDQYDLIATLPIDVQVAALEAIGHLSIRDPKQFAQIIRSIGDAASRSSVLISGARH